MTTQNENWAYTLQDAATWAETEDGGHDDYTSAEAAQNAAHDAYDLQCAEGEEFKEPQTGEAVLIRYERDQDGKPSVLETREIVVSYEYQRPDYEEHGTWR